MKSLYILGLTTIIMSSQSWAYDDECKVYNALTGQYAGSSWYPITLSGNQSTDDTNAVMTCLKQVQASQHAQCGNASILQRSPNYSVKLFCVL